MFVLSIFGLTKKNNPPLSFYFVFSENIYTTPILDLWNPNLHYSLHHQILSKATTNFTSKNKAPSNYLSVLAIHHNPSNNQHQLHFQKSHGGIDYCTQPINCTWKS